MTLPARTRRRQQKLARLARRTPGYRWAAQELLPRIRSNPVLNDLAWRVFVPGTSAGEVEMPLHGGRPLQGQHVSRLPVVGIVGLGLDDSGADELIQEVAGLQQELQSFRPLLILDRPAFAAAREHGYVLEVVLGATGWDGAEHGWTGYVGDRLASIIDHYQLWHLALAEGSRLRPLDLAILGQLGHRLPPDLLP